MAGQGVAWQGSFMDISNDLDYNQLDMGIRKVVRWLREQGFETTDSGDGESKSDGARVFDMPHVAIRCTRKDLITEADRLEDLILTHLRGIYEEIHIEATYDPSDRSCVLLLLRLSDWMLPW